MFILFILSVASTLSILSVVSIPIIIAWSLSPPPIKSPSLTAIMLSTTKRIWGPDKKLKKKREIAI